MTEVIVNAHLTPETTARGSLLESKIDGLIVLRDVDVIVDGIQRSAVEIEADVNITELLEAIKQAGFTVLENAIKEEQ